MKSSALAGMSFWVIIFSTGVATGCGLTVLIAGQAKPIRPSLVSETNSVDKVLASSTACAVIWMPPMVTLSVPTVPEADEPSPVDSVRL